MTHRAVGATHTHKTPQSFTFTTCSSYYEFLRCLGKILTYYFTVSFYYYSILNTQKVSLKCKCKRSRTDVFICVMSKRSRRSDRVNFQLSFSKFLFWTGEEGLSYESYSIFIVHHSILSSLKIKGNFIRCGMNAIRDITCIYRWHFIFTKYIHVEEKTIEMRGMSHYGTSKMHL